MTARGGLGPAVPAARWREDAAPRSEEARAVLGSVPHRAIRSAQGALLAILLCALLIAWFIRYPDEIRAPVSLTTGQVQAGVVARASGTLVLLARDGQAVRGGEALGYLETAARAGDVLRLREAVGSFREAFAGGDPPAFPERRFLGEELGELGDAYLAFEEALVVYRLWARQGGAAAQEGALGRRIAGYRQLIAQSETAGAIQAQELAIARARYQADSVLAARQLVSALDYQERRRAFLALERELGGAAAAVTDLHITVGELQGDLAEVRRQSERDEQELSGALERSLARLWKEIEEWERLYVLRAPRDGRVALDRYWASHQYVRASDEVLAIVPERGDTVFGFIRAPIAGSGRLAPGQRVRIALDEHPAAEYGELLGTVTRISPVARDSSYRVTVALPGGLTTTSGRTLPPRHEHRGSAVIVTRDRRLLERLFAGRVPGGGR